MHLNHRDPTAAVHFHACIRLLAFTAGIIDTIALLQRHDNASTTTPIQDGPLAQFASLFESRQERGAALAERNYRCPTRSLGVGRGKGSQD